MSEPRTLSALLRISWLALALSAPATLSAQNLLSNPEFDGFGTTGDPDDPFPGWDSSGLTDPTAGEDADGCTNSDSYHVEAATGGRGATALDCIEVVPGETLHLEVSYRSSALVEMIVREFSDAACMSGFAGFTEPDIPASGDWTTIRDQHVVGLAQNSVKLSLRAAAETAWFVEFDRAYFGRAERVFADDFEGGFYCRWDAVATPPEI